MEISIMSTVSGRYAIRNAQSAIRDAPYDPTKYKPRRGTGLALKLLGSLCPWTFYWSIASKPA